MVPGPTSERPVRNPSDIRSLHPEVAKAAAMLTCRFATVENDGPAGWAPALAERLMR
jgi:hypothetical protein